MCAIALILHYDDGPDRVDRDELLRMRDRMVSRGPDGAGEWYSADAKVGLAHRRLSIVDLSGEASQPMSAASGTTIIFNGEIYNHRELRKVLEGKGYLFRSQSDTEVLLHLYAEHRADMVHHLRGMFAFAIWDSCRRCLFLARDPFGIKPLYYSEVSQTFRAASQVKALLSSKRIPLDPHPAGQAGFLLWGHVPEPFTLYRHIRSLEPGTTLTITASGQKVRQAFSSIPRLLAGSSHSEFTVGTGEGSVHQSSGKPVNIARRKVPPTPFKTRRNNSFLEPLRGWILESLEHHLHADVPVGVFLSSGTDSSTLTALASELRPAIRTVTLGFHEYRGTPRDEVPLAEAVANRYGTDHTTVWVSRPDFEEHQERLLDEMDQPTVDGVNTYFVSLAAARAGLKVALSGIGGDELFGGYPSFTQLPRITRLVRSFANPSALGRAARLCTVPFLGRMTSPKYAGLLEYGHTFGGAYLLRRGMFMPWELPDLIGAVTARDGLEELDTLSRLNGACVGLSSAHAKICALETCWYMRNQLLRDTDWASMAHSLEVRTPFVDITLLRTLAPSINSPAPFTKAHLSRIPAHPLPDEVLNRPKTGFNTPIRDWLQDSRSSFDARPPRSARRGLRSWAYNVYRSFVP